MQTGLHQKCLKYRFYIHNYKEKIYEILNYCVLQSTNATYMEEQPLAFTHQIKDVISAEKSLKDGEYSSER